MFKALVLGGTGLVGAALVAQLIDEKKCSEIVLFGRTNPNLLSPKVSFEPMDADKLNLLQDKLNGDVLFIAFGTTINKAGSQAAFEKIDAEIPAEIATMARKNGVKAAVLVSALGADENSSVFYNRIKGKLENILIKLQFEKLILLRPSLLLGERKEKRTGERLAQIIMPKLEFLFLGGLKKYRSVSAKQVAAAMLHYYYESAEKVKIVENDAILNSKK